MVAFKGGLGRTCRLLERQMKATWVRPVFKNICTAFVHHSILKGAESLETWTHKVCEELRVMCDESLCEGGMPCHHDMKTRGDVEV